jgi:hypothetical protein
MANQLPLELQFGPFIAGIPLLGELHSLAVLLWFASNCVTFIF